MEAVLLTRPLALGPFRKQDDVAKASREQKEQALSRLGEVVDAMTDPDRAPSSDATVLLASMVSAMTKVFLALGVLEQQQQQQQQQRSSGVLGESMGQRFVFAVCDLSAGVMRTFDPAALRGRVWNTRPEWRVRARADIASIMASARVSRAWNIVVGGSFDMSDMCASARWSERTALVAFERRDWQWLERTFVSFAGADDVPMRLAKMLHKLQLCKRYDVLLPVDRRTMRLWTLPSPAPGLGAGDNGGDNGSGSGGDNGSGSRPADACCARCVRCRQPASMRCAGCMSARYCSPACQAEGWSAGHRELCKQIRDAQMAHKFVLKADVDRTLRELADLEIAVHTSADV